MGKEELEDIFEDTFIYVRYPEISQDILRYLRISCNISGYPAISQDLLRYLGIS